MSAVTDLLALRAHLAERMAAIDAALEREEMRLCAAPDPLAGLEIFAGAAGQGKVAREIFPSAEHHRRHEEQLKRQEEATVAEKTHPPLAENPPPVAKKPLPTRSPSRQLVEKVLAENPLATAKEIAAATGLTQVNAAYHLTQMLKEKGITREKSHKKPPSPRPWTAVPSSPLKGEGERCAEQGQPYGSGRAERGATGKEPKFYEAESREGSAGLSLNTKLSSGASAAGIAAQHTRNGSGQRTRLTKAEYDRIKAEISRVYHANPGWDDDQIAAAIGEPRYRVAQLRGSLGLKCHSGRKRGEHKRPEALTEERLLEARRVWNSSGMSEKAMRDAVGLSKGELVYLRQHRDLLKASNVHDAPVEVVEENGVPVRKFAPGYARGAAPQKSVRQV